MKIINIASSDNFNDILEAVRASDSGSVILIVPRSNRVFKSKSGLEKLKVHFDGLKKEVSVISSGPETVKNAGSVGFNVLSKIENKKEKAPIKKDEEIESFYSAQLDSEFRKEYGTDSRKFIFGLLGGAIALFAFIVFASLGGAEIKIIPAKKDFSVNIPIIVSDRIIENDGVYGMIPGQWFEIEKVFSKSFVSSSEKEVFQKAAGRITVYNNFSTSPQILVATTRFQTSEGLVFRILKTITVPAAVKVGDKLKPGEIETEAVADRAGEEYNIEPSDFRIPGFVGSPKYQGFYAKSFEKFSGGFVGRSSFVSKEDFEKAEKEASDEALARIKAEIYSLDGLKILDEAVKTEIEKTADSNNAGDLTKEFSIFLKIKAKTVAFKEKDAADFVYQYVRNSQNILPLEKGLKIEYGGLNLNEEKKELSFKLISSGLAVQNIDKNRIILEAAGRKKKEAEIMINNLDGVESANISSFFWLRSVPKNIDKIDIKIITE